MSNVYIGGNFASKDIESFYMSSSETQLNKFFPEKRNSLTRSFFETGVDALSSILSDVKVTNMRLWFPDNYCEETIQRVLLKTGITDTRKYLIIDDIHFESDVFNVLVVVHFNGYFETTVAKIKDVKNKSNILVIEDYVQAPFEICFFTGDFAFNSLRKIVNIDISVAYKKENIVVPRLFSHYYHLKKEAESLKSEFLISGRGEIEKQFLEMFTEAEKCLMNEFIWVAYEKEIKKMTSIDFVKIKDVRTKNFNYLKEKLMPENNIKILDGDYLFLMIECNRRNELRKFLFEHNIFAPIHWADSNSEISNHILSLPIDQRYGFSEMTRLSDAIIQFYTNGAGN